jgi:hypothetical protein
LRYTIKVVGMLVMVMVMRAIMIKVEGVSGRKVC